MQKTFCDKCGAECVNYKARIGGSVMHTTSQGEEVGEDYIQHRDLCRACAEALFEAAGIEVISEAAAIREKRDSEPRAVAAGDWG